MSKVLISLLGTGKKADKDKENNNYEKTDYEIDDKLYKNKTFVSSAIIEHYHIDTLYLIGTKESMWDNVYSDFNDDEKHYYEILAKKESKPNILKEEDLSPLDNAINNKLPSKNSKCFIIENGQNEEELWVMFNKFIEILDLVNDDDELFFDITHLFRSVTVMSFVMAEFGKTYKNYKVSGIFYGLLKKGEPSTIVNLEMFFKLLDWSKAIYNLKKYGNAFELMVLINESNQAKEIKNSFSNFSNALSISDVSALQNSIKQLKGKLELFKNSDNTIMQLISKDLKNFINALDDDELHMFQYKLALWYKENKNYAMFYMTIGEATISAICEQEKLNPEDKDDRKKAQNIIYNYSDWKQDNTRDNKTIGDAYSKISNIRNNIAHKVSTGKHAKSNPKDSITNADKYIQDLKGLFNAKK